MRLDLVFIPVIFALVIIALMFIKPIEVQRADLSAVFLYWPEAYKYAEKGDAAAIYRIAGLAVCLDTRVGVVINAPPGLAYKAVNLTCRFKP